MTTTPLYGNLPILVDNFDIQLSEVMYWLYLPVAIDEQGLGTTTGYDIRLPPPLEVCRPLIKAAIQHAYEGWSRDYTYVYLSARKGIATPGNPLNRPGWHCDGFGTEDLNYVWWRGPGTRFAAQTFYGIVSDHNRSLQQFDEQVKEDSIATYPEGGLYGIDPSVVHATPIIKETCWRQYIKVSLSNHRYNLENNSHNWLFDYKWDMHNRELARNDTAKAGRDYF